MDDYVRIEINILRNHVADSEEEMLKAVKDKDILGRGKVKKIFKMSNWKCSWKTGFALLLWYQLYMRRKIMEVAKQKIRNLKKEKEGKPLAVQHQAFWTRCVRQG